MNSNCEALASGSSSTGSSSHCSSGAGEIGRGAVPRRRRAGPGAGAAAGAGGGSLVVSAGAGAAGVASSSVWGRRAVFRRSSNVGPESSDLWPASLSCPRDPVSAAVLRRGEVRGGAGAGAGVGAGAAACAGARGARGDRPGGGRPRARSGAASAGSHRTAPDASHSSRGSGRPTSADPPAPASP